jgi:hypothetical protein
MRQNKNVEPVSDSIGSEAIRASSAEALPEARNMPRSAEKEPADRPETRMDLRAYRSCVMRPVGVVPWFPASVCAAILLAGGCSAGKLSSFDAPDTAGSSKLAELLGIAKDPGPAVADAIGDAKGRRVTCPEIGVLEGTEVARLYAASPPSSTTLRVQYAIDDTARECSVRDAELVLKIGVAGKVLLGPAGSPASFTVPVRVAVVRKTDQTAVASRLYRVAATIAAKRTEESFTVVSEPISVPFIHAHSEEDYSIKVGIDSAAGSGPTERESRKR